MNDLEISKALALAIGWLDIYEDPDVQIVLPIYGAPSVEVWFNKSWLEFDYRDWNVIGPIANKFDCFPYKWRNTNLWVLHDSVEPYADTPQKAIAMAVIERATP